MAERSIVLGFSGGMDSVTSALRLRDEGWRVVATTLDTVGDEAMIAKARKVAAEIGVEHRVVDVREEFQKHIISYFCDSYASGRTPAPCTVCNSAIKWRWLEHEANRLGIEHIATGHYFKVERHGGLCYVARATDSQKDQSYYLWGLKQDTQRRIVTPMGDVVKSTIKANFADKRESMGLCFLQGMAYRDFLREHCPATARKGEVVDVEGRIVGRHDGVAFYTIGQKRGFECEMPGVAVVAIDAARNRLVVGEDALLYKSTLELTGCNIVDKEEFIGSCDVSVVVRGIGRNPEGFIRRVEPIEGGFRVELENPAWAPAAGQPVVFYRQNRVIGGGFVECYG